LFAAIEHLDQLPRQYVPIDDAERREISRCAASVSACGSIARSAAIFGA
jgi:hypothetical protein